MGSLGAVLVAAAACCSAHAEVSNPNGVGVIIGNADYEHRDVPDAAYAHRDAEAFRRYVVEVLGTRRDPRSLLWSYLHPEGGSDVVVFYSGHGVPGVNDGRGYLLPVDAAPEAAEDDGYPIDLLYENVGGLAEARSVQVFLDACFSGGSHAGGLIGNASPVYVAAALPEGLGDKVTALAAASGEQVASWDEGAEHGLFTHHLLDALYGGGDADGDGRVTAVEAKGYLDRHMTRAARRQHRRIQHASLMGAQRVVLASAPEDGAFPPRPMLNGSEATMVAGGEEEIAAPLGKSPDDLLLRSAQAGDMKGLEASLASGAGIDTRDARGLDGADVGREGGLCAHGAGTARSGGEPRPAGGGWRDRAVSSGAARPRGVSWEDAQSYVRWLSRKTGEAYRLPSEAEWEYVARAGTTTPFHFGATLSTVQANYDGSYTYGSGRKGRYRKKTVPVGSFGSNRFGLHDVHGNVWEWVQDCWNNSYRRAPRDGSAWGRGDCSRRVLRGGSWPNAPWVLRSANRLRSSSGIRDFNVGFRVARTLSP